MWYGAGVRAAVAEFAAIARAELASVEPGLAITAEMAHVRGGKVLRRPLQRRVLQVLAALPHGVVKMSADIPGLVETSTTSAAEKPPGVEASKAVALFQPQTRMSSRVDAIVAAKELIVMMTRLSG